METDAGESTTRGRDRSRVGSARRAPIDQIRRQNGDSRPARRLGLSVPAFIVIVAIVVRVAMVAWMLIRLPDNEPIGYVERFTEIAVEDGRPYRDYPVEYPPVTLGAIEIVGQEDTRATAVRLLWLTLVADAIVVASLAWGWGLRAVALYLGVSVLVLDPIYQTLDIVPVALATAALALTKKRKERGAGVLLAAAILGKLWPVALVPGLLVWGRRRALAWCLACAAAGTLLWVGWAGTGAIGQVTTQRHTPGWEAESTVGALVWMLGDDEAEPIKDSPRVGTAPGWAKGALTAAIVAGVAGLWLFTARRGLAAEFGAPSLACVGLLLFFSPIYSYPYVLWLLPFTAVSFAERRAGLAALGSSVIVLTVGVLLAAAATESFLWNQIGLTLRNVATGAIPLAYVLSSRSVSSRALEPARLDPSPAAGR